MVLAELPSLKSFQERAAEFGSVLAVPPLETTPEEIADSLTEVMAEADRAGDVIAELPADELTYENVILALDDLGYDVRLAVARFWLLKEVSPDPVIREAATEAVKQWQDWSVEFNYREDIYQAVDAFAQTEPELEGLEKRLFEDTLRDYRRLGFHLPVAAREDLQVMKKELAELQTDFDGNIREAQAEVVLTPEEAVGLSESLRKATVDEEGNFRIQSNITWQHIGAMEQADLEETRERLITSRYSLAQEENVPLMQRIVNLRARIAQQLGYANWADFKTEIKMSGSGETVRTFLADLVEGLEPKWQAELDEFRKMKARDTGTPVEDTQVNLWDWRYYAEKLRKERFDVDTEALKAYFPYEATLAGTLSIYEDLLSLKIEQVENPYKWHEDVTLYVVSDRESGEPLGLFYLDMFPREGKFNHFAQFGLVQAKAYPDGTVRRPVAALVCNFTPATEDTPSLMTFRHVETLFHEFGHALHTILSRSTVSKYSGTSVPRDFVEVPSQALEYWVKDKAVLDRFAADYRDPENKIPQDLLDRIEAAQLATIGGFYRRQLTFGTMDLRFHSKGADEELDVLDVCNDTFAEVSLAAPRGTGFIAYFGHLTGYDAGYYGYAWSDVIAADIASVFASSPRGYMDPELGKRFRDEILATGNTREVTDSVRAFLGRESSTEPFLQKLGIN